MLRERERVACWTVKRRKLRQVAYLDEDLDAQLHKKVFRVVQGVEVQGAQAFFSVMEIKIYVWQLRSWLMRKGLHKIFTAATFEA
jgi:hypothetical protein